MEEKRGRRKKTSVMTGPNREFSNSPVPHWFEHDIHHSARVIDRIKYFDFYFILRYSCFLQN